MTSLSHKVIVKAWIKKDGKYLLARRGATEKHHAGVLSLPGGNVDNDITESILEKTLEREIQEEVGIEIEDNCILIYNNGFIKDSDGSHVINLTFLCKWKSGIAQPLEDTSEVMWLSLAELRSLSDAQPFLLTEIEYLVQFVSSSV